MEKDKLQNAFYSYLVLYRNGITVEDVLANKAVFYEICNRMNKKNKSILNANLEFVFKNDFLFEIKTTRDTEFVFQIDIANINFDILTKLLFSQISCSDFLCQNCQLIDIPPATFDVEDEIKVSGDSWGKFIERIGYKEEDF